MDSFDIYMIFSLLSSNLRHRNFYNRFVQSILTMSVLQWNFLSTQMNTTADAKWGFVGENTKSTGQILNTIYSIRLMKCHHTCLTRKECNAINFLSQTKETSSKCVLIRREPTDDVITEEKWVSYHIISPEQSCVWKHDTCWGHGTCSLTKKSRFAECTCDRPFLGAYCKTGMLVIQVLSYGKDDEGGAHLSWINVNNGERIYRGQRGFLVLPIDGKTGKSMDFRIFDTHNSEAARRNMTSYLQSLSDGTIVVLGMEDDVSFGFQNKTLADMLRLVSGNVGYLPFRGSYCLIGYKGKMKPNWVVESAKAAKNGPSRCSSMVALPTI